MFLDDETGAVTVDWVVLTAALVGLGLAAMNVVSGGVEDTSSDIDQELNSNIVSAYFTGSLEYFQDTVAVTGCSTSTEEYGQQWANAGSTLGRMGNENGWNDTIVASWNDTYSAMTPAEQQAALDTLNTEAGYAYTVEGGLDVNALTEADHPATNPYRHVLKTLVLECMLAD